MHFGKYNVSDSDNVIEYFYTESLLRHSSMVFGLCGIYLFSLCVLFIVLNKTQNEKLGQKLKIFVREANCKKTVSQCSMQELYK